MDHSQILNVLVPTLAVLVGFALKRASWYPTKFIPIASFALAIILRFASGLGVTPAEGAVAVAGFNLGTLFLILRAVIDALIATGAQSAPKNIAEGLRLRKLKVIQGLPPGSTKP
jgi:hypothetical protein